MFDKIQSFYKDHETEIKCFAIGAGVGAAAVTAYFLVKDRNLIKLPLRMADPTKDRLAKKNLHEWWSAAMNGCTVSYGGDLCVNTDPEVIQAKVEDALKYGAKYGDAKYYLMLGCNGNMPTAE